MTNEASISCPLCGEGATLTTDLVTDQTGKAVHEECYFNRMTGKSYAELPLPFLAMITRAC
jgi:hypothetical protein